jgi:hypothetical protein
MLADPDPYLDHVLLPALAEARRRLNRIAEELLNAAKV